VEHFVPYGPDLLALLWAEDQLCAICEERLWTQCGRWHRALICPDCAVDEPDPEEDAPED